MPVVFEVQGNLDVSVVEAAARAILERHEILRSVFFEKDSQAWQQVRSMAEVDFALGVTDLTGVAPDLLADTLRSHIDEHMNRPFVLASDLMLRMDYLKTGDSQGMLVLNMHHIASDGWSLQILLREFFALYQAKLAGTRLSLPPLAIQYADYAHWLQSDARRKDFERQLAYWQKTTGRCAADPFPHPGSRPAQGQTRRIRRLFLPS